MHSEMGPVWQNPIQRTVRTAHLYTASIHNTTQCSSDNLPSYRQTSIIAQTLSIGGEDIRGQCIAPVHSPDFAGYHFAYPGETRDDQAELTWVTEMVRTTLESANGHVQRSIHVVDYDSAHRKSG